MPVKAQDLPGVEGEGVSRPKIKEIETASERYIEVRDQRMELTQKEVKLRDNLVALMKKHGLERYEYSDEVVKLIPGKDKIKVSVATSEEDEGED